MNALDIFLSDVVMTGYYLAEPPRLTTKDLHDAEMKCLKIISVFGPLQVHEIADLMYTTKARATQLTHTLERYGYVRHHHSEIDRRVKLMSITEEGEAVVKHVRQKYRKLARAVEHKLGKQKTKELCLLLAEITPLSALAHKNVSEATKTKQLIRR